ERLARFVRSGCRGDPRITQAARIHLHQGPAHLATLAPQSEHEGEALAPAGTAGGRRVKVGGAEQAVAGLVAHLSLLLEVMRRGWSLAYGLSITLEVIARTRASHAPRRKTC